ncbi:unnamed protein product [Leuciscus chuanchicus]
MAAGNVNPFNVSDSEEEAEHRQDGADSERSPSDEAQGHSLGPFSPPAYSEPASRPATEPARVWTGYQRVGSAETRVSLDAIAAQLLRDQYILTALELHTELLEAGRELPRLRDYFSNPGNFERQSGTPPACKEQGVGPGGPLIFPLTPAAQVQDRKRRNRDAHTRDRAGSISTLDSLDFARYSDDGNRESDERVADLLHVYRNCGNSLPLNMNTVDVAVSVDPSDLPGDYFTQQPVQQTEQQQEVVQELEYQISLLNTEKQSLAEQIKKLQR